MYLFRFLNTTLGGGGAATQTFSPGGKYHRAATARPALTPASKLVLDLPTPEGWEAELTLATRH